VIPSSLNCESSLKLLIPCLNTSALVVSFSPISSSRIFLKIFSSPRHSLPHRLTGTSLFLFGFHFRLLSGKNSHQRHPFVEVSGPFCSFRSWLHPTGVSPPWLVSFLPFPGFRLMLCNSFQLKLRHGLCQVINLKRMTIR